MSNTQVIRPSELPEILAYSWAKDHPVLVMGPSGCGKSSIIEQQARVRGQELGYECFWKLGDPLPANPANTFAFIDFRLASMDASDVKGFGSLDMDEGITRFLPPENMPRIDTHGAAGYLFADEIDKADDGAVDSFTQLMLTKVLGSYLFPPTKATSRTLRHGAGRWHLRRCNPSMTPSCNGASSQATLARQHPTPWQAFNR